MAFNCKLIKNITLNDSSSSEIGCGSTEIATGGIRSRIYLYNIEDIINLTFENDNREDDTQIIDTINTAAKYLYVDASTVTYEEKVENKLFTHTLTLTLNNITPTFENILTDAANGKYLVAFNPNGFDDYRVFGWKEGADLTYSLSINESTSSYTVTISDSSEYSLMTAYKDNFMLADKVFSPIFRPNFEQYVCVKSNGNNTGYVIAAYATKENIAGQALDEDNKLASYSGKPQQAYKYTTMDDGGYDILGTYTDTASFDGVVVKKYDRNLCPPTGSGSISLGTLQTFYSGRTEQTLSITCSDSWKFIEIPSFIGLSQIQGDGNANIMVTASGGGEGKLVIQNTTTLETKEIDVKSYFIKVTTPLTYPNGTLNIYVNPIAEGGSEDFTYSLVSGSATITKTDDKRLKLTVSKSNNVQNIKLNIAHKDYAQENKDVDIVVLGLDTEPVWVVVSQFCETA